MRLTPTLLEACYNFLRATPPFRRWDLPEGKWVKFVVQRGRDRMGSYRLTVGERHLIGISGARVAHVNTLLTTMAHEMVHLHQAHRGTDTRAEHNADFRRLSKIVCRHHGHDPLEF